MVSLREGGLMVLIFFLYLFGALWGLSLHSVGGFAAVVWPPTGIAIAAFYFSGYRMAMPIALAAFAANAISGAPLLVAALIAAGNTLEGIIAAHTLQSFHLDPLFRRLKDSLIFIGVALLAPALSATIGAASLLASGVVPEALGVKLFISWWVGNSLGTLVTGGFLLRWIAKPFFYRTKSELAEMAFAYLLLALANIAVIVGALSAFGGNPIAYFLLPFLWISIREGSRGITLASIMTGVFLIWDTQQGIGLFSGADFEANFLHSQLLLGMLAMLFLVFASAMEERKQAAFALERNVSELERALRRLRNSAREKNEFITILAHELRNPLAPIVSSLELLKLQNGTSPQADRSLVDSIEHGALSMRRLLDDLLDISRLSRRGFSLQKAQIDLIETLQRSIASAKMLTSERNQKLTASTPAYPLWINADQLRIEQILTNLITNAIKYTGEGGQIDIACMERDGHALVEVRDNGIGIAPERLPQIFEPFQRLDPGAGSKGLGVGLSLAQKLAHLHGGSLVAASGGKGMGSTFTLSIPLARRSQLAALLPFEEAHHETERQYKVLVVDDNVPAAEALAQLLRTKGHTVSLAKNGGEALERVTRAPPDVAIIDIGLPDIDGHTLAKRIKKNGFSGVLIALSGFGQPEDKARSRSSGFRRHLTKPATLSDIEGVLRTI